jgi:peptide/nickel transport system ATP-binding protein
MTAPLLQLRQLRLSLGAQQLLCGVDLEIAPAQVLALVGESGSGKTLTALSAIRLEPESAVLSGSIKWCGQELIGLDEVALTAVRGRGIGMLFQDSVGSLHPTRSVGSQLRRLLRWHGGATRKQARQQACDWLSRVGLSKDLLVAFAHELSGGQAQRVALALALACGPRLLICDEPTSALDVSSQRQVMQLLLDLKAQLDLSLLLITHDLALAADYADHIAVMRRGQIQEIQAAGELWAAPRSDYGKALLACRPSITATPMRLPTVSVDGTWVAGDATPRVAPLASTTAPLLQVQQLNFAYPGRGWARWFGTQPLTLEQINFALQRGRTLGIVGESGSGKSTLARALVRLIEVQGDIRYDDLDVRALRGSALRSWRKRVQMVFQNPYTALNPALTIGRQLLEPLLIHQLGGTPQMQLRRVQQLLDEVGLPADALNRYPEQFSGGQRQRIAIARALACEPELLICDESVSALDVSVQAQVLNLLAQLRDRRGLTLIFISHDLAVIRFLADDVLVLQHGKVVEYAPANALFDQPQHPYTQALLAAVPRGLNRAAG